MQERAGVRPMAERVGNSIHSTIPQAAREFLEEQLMVVVGSVDADGRVWASPLVGEPGFLRVLALPLISLSPTFPFCVFTEVEGDGSVEDQRRTVLP